MRDLPWPWVSFDAAYVRATASDTWTDVGNVAFLDAVRRALKPGARFVLESPMVLEQ